MPIIPKDYVASGAITRDADFLFTQEAGKRLLGYLVRTEVFRETTPTDTARQEGRRDLVIQLVRWTESVKGRSSSEGGSSK